MLHATALPSPTWIRAEGADIATYVLEPTDVDAVGDVVLCHGTPWSAAIWLPVAQRLAARYRVLLWDMPGYGASITDDAPPVDLIHQRRRLGAVLTHAGVERPHVVAHDIGGAVALGAHLLEDVDFASLYLTDVVALDPWGSPFFRLVAEHEDVFAALPADLHAALVREYIAGAIRGDLDGAWVPRLTEPWLSSAGQRAFYRQIAQLRPEHTRAFVGELGDVRCATRVAWGERDPWIPVEQAAALAALLPPPVDVVLVPDAGHLVPVEASEALGDDVLHWLDDRTA